MARRRRVHLSAADRAGLLDLAFQRGVLMQVAQRPLAAAAPRVQRLQPSLLDLLAQQHLAGAGADELEPALGCLPVRYGLLQQRDGASPAILNRGVRWSARRARPT